MRSKIDILSPLRCKYGPSEDFYELGYKDKITDKGMYRFAYAPIRELDPEYLDGPVKDSRMSVTDGGDSYVDPSQGVGYRYMGMPMDEWRFKVLYRQNPTVKHIYENWDISPEHPGLKFRNGYRSAFTDLYWQGNMSTIGKLWFSRIMPGGRYYDAPEGEECFIKSWACSRNVLAAMIPIYIYDLFAIQQMETILVKPAISRFFQITYLPVTAAFIWGAITCFVADKRKEDDLINYFWGSVAAGTVFGLKRGLASGIRWGVGITAMTWFWRVARDCWEGPFGTTEHFSVAVGDALSHRWARWETNLRSKPIPMDY